MARAACKLVSFYYSWLKPTLVLLSLKLANAFSLRGTATDFWGRCSEPMFGLTARFFIRRSLRLDSVAGSFVE